jgi:hypothetical protein
MIIIINANYFQNISETYGKVAKFSLKQIELYIATVWIEQRELDSRMKISPWFLSLTNV